MPTDEKISELDPVGTLLTTDLVPVVTGVADSPVAPVTKYATIAEVVALAGGGSSGTPAGAIASWTGVNVGANWSATDVGDIIEAVLTDGGLNWRGLFRTQPATPYTVTFVFDTYQSFSNSQTFGVYFYDGTKLMGIELLVQASNAITLRVEKITNVTTDSGTAFSVAAPVRLSPTIVMLQGAGAATPRFTNVQFRLSNTGANLSFAWSADGEAWNTVFTEAIGTFITPTKYGFGGLNVGSSATMRMVMKTATLG